MTLRATSFVVPPPFCLEPALAREMTEARDDWRWGSWGGVGVDERGGGEEDGGGVGVVCGGGLEEDGVVREEEEFGWRVAPAVARGSWPGGTCQVALYISTHPPKIQTSTSITPGGEREREEKKNAP
jgi:hypothetical protein